MLLAELFGQMPATAPLYHFTTLQSFYQILDSNVLKAHARISHDDRRRSVSFTRDPRRSFMAGGFGEGIGFRIDRDKLAARHKLVPSVHNTIKKRRFIGGREETPSEMQMSGRFESEERVYGDIPNFKQYITGIVVPKGGKWERAGMPTPMKLALTILGMSGAFSRQSQSRQFAKDIRDAFLNTAQELNIPLIQFGKEFSPAEVSKAIGKVYWLKKNKPQEYEALLSDFFHVEKDNFGRTTTRFSGNTQIQTGRATFGELARKKSNETQRTA